MDKQFALTVEERLFFSPTRCAFDSSFQAFILTSGHYMINFHSLKYLKM